MSTPTETRCYDCLKTKGFGITIALIAISMSIVLSFIIGVLTFPINTFEIILFIIFWVGIAIVILVPSLIATYAISDYCNKTKTSDYKNPKNIAVFGICVVFALIIISATAVTFVDNYNAWVPVKESIRYTLDWDDNKIVEYSLCTRSITGYNNCSVDTDYSLKYFCSDIKPEHGLCKQ